jgi:hypothetical protein
MDARTWEVVSPRSTDEPVEQGFSCGGGGGKEVSRGETGWQYTHRTLCRIERGIAARPVTPGGCRGLEGC